MSKLAYLGPRGTFCDAALRRLAPDAESLACANVGAALDAARDGTADGAVVPLENSVEGAITQTLDQLARGVPLLITGELLLPVEFSLLVRPGTESWQIKRIISHPAAITQCRGYVEREFPDADVVAWPSTAAAAQEVAAAGSPYDAAISPAVAAGYYGLAEFASGIGDRSDTVTRFVRVSRPGSLPQPTGADRTSLVVFLRDDHPGALMEMLSEFAVRGVNLSRIESRPTGDGIGHYFFHFDCEGHVADARVGEAIAALHRRCLDVRFLGSYPRADRGRPRIGPGMSESEFAEAASWLDRIRSGGA
ncbi:prephenate dehydratase [Microbispora sp. RL4-1S]|uniref:Prephenate dehydratase n=1 Tax=Microbispora oryzae TaxID=2806554 RepID=A0A940WMX5_9ACTN|nr:prephenate dehydratase [Microbispora oryzae]MBP2706312.1 prephenate dehydratase [Microbispora oryzae]